MVNFKTCDRVVAGVIMLKKEEDLAAMKRQNNPDNKPSGPFTGRCSLCGSTDLWDDNLAYGCKICGAFLGSN